MEMDPSPKLHMPSQPVWAPSVFAVKASADFASLPELRDYLRQAIPQNSELNRKRTAAYIIMRFFSNEDYNSLPRRVWIAYQDEKLLEMIMRYFFLVRERLVGRFVEEILFSIEPGTTLDRKVFERFVTGLYSEQSRIQSGIKRIRDSCRELGFIERSAKGNVFRVLSLNDVETPLLILLHHLFAPEPRTITMSDILANPFWKDIGFRSEDSVRQVLKEAAAKDILAKYVVADQLEQVTTKYTLDEFLAQRVRL